MLITSPYLQAERRQFSVHAGILKTLIHQQAGTISKAVAELVMNAVDAGATEIIFDLAPDGSFSFSDNGRGFQSREEIEQFFEMFGTPHEEDDAQYGRFRIGRGQIMSFARTVWRSGKFEMRVDLEASDTASSYDLISHEETHHGCRISGAIYSNNRGDATYFVQKLIGRHDDLDSTEFSEQVKYVSIPIIVNGQVINELPDTVKWDFEDEHAYYRLDRLAHELALYNQGVLVCRLDARRYGTGGIVSSKQALTLNTARNEALCKCKVWRRIEENVRERFMVKLKRLSKLKETEAASLLHDLAHEVHALSYNDRVTIRGLRFIPDIFGEQRTPDQTFESRTFTLFDNKHTAIAERVQRQGVATVVMPVLLRLARIDITPHNAELFLERLLAQLGYSHTWRFVPFDHFVRELSATSEILPDDAITLEEQIVLAALRDINASVWQICGRPGVSRRIVAGISDCMAGWTDGESYIAIDRESLQGIRTSRYKGRGHAYLVNLMVHEYCHDATSMGDHHHDHDFYARFHNAVMSAWFSDIVDTFLRKYIAGISKHGIPPSDHHGKHIRWLAEKAPTLLFRKKSLNKGASQDKARNDT